LAVSSHRVEKDSVSFYFLKVQRDVDLADDRLDQERNSLLTMHRRELDSIFLRSSTDELVMETGDARKESFRAFSSSFLLAGYRLHLLLANSGASG
jgi:hypothetical protein